MNPPQAEPTVVVELERQIAAWRHSLLAQQPAHLRELAAIVRRAVIPRNLRKLERWCNKHDLPIERSVMPLFRDFLILRLLELKDLEPAARARLRQHWLAQQDPADATNDYLASVRAGEALRCGDCRFFVRPPDDENDADPDSTKSCVGLGTKGADVACFGFRRLS
jgi:hypothetical protein